MADGPLTERHRFREFRPLPLCLWYERDTPDRKWNFTDGLVGLIDLTRTHLLREARFRQHGRWPGPEIHLETKEATNRALRRAYERERPRVKCWCGGGRRYIRCHGQLPRAGELAVLGLLARNAANHEHLKQVA
jgi:hypothetical protein